MNELLLITVAQICLESLPISSSGHVMLITMLYEVVMKRSIQVPSYFDHFLHGPTLIIISLFFFSSWWQVVKLFYNNFLSWWQKKKVSSWQMQACVMYKEIIIWIVLADSVTACMYGIGKVLSQFPKIVPQPLMLLAGLSVTMFLFACLWWYERSGEKKISISCRHDRWQWLLHAVVLGGVQGLALIPGISRFASTFIVARLLGYSPKKSFATSFALFAPLIGAAFFVNALPKLIMKREWLDAMSISLLAAMVGATVLGYALFCWSYRLARAEKLWWFGVYLLVPISLLLVVMAL